MNENFQEVRILDNYYQTSSFFPMPVALVSTLAENGQTNLGPYSLCFPHMIAGSHAMMLITRSASNTAGNIRRTGLAALNFIPARRRYLESCVRLGFPGEETAEKMKGSVFTLRPSTRGESGSVPYPQIVQESVQVFECAWDSAHDDSPSPDESHFLLRIEKIVMPKRWHDALLAGRRFPSLPVDYGYRDNTRFWFARHGRPYAINIPKGKGSDAATVLYQAQRLDPDVQWDLESCQKLVGVPRLFLKQVLSGINEKARKRGISKITPALLDELRDKRSS
ncbi:MAG: hypothetical protein NTV33_00505 [Coprothermobacterota bacterium]|nr:hypothetical protein [Coprothermobacterota bacterium]